MPPTDAPPPPLDARARLLAAAFDLFHAKGVPATSVDEILAASDTGKSQLYHYFGSKDGLVHAVVEEFDRMLRDGELPGTAPLVTVDDLERWFAAFVGFQRMTGAARTCPMATIAAGLGPGQEATRDLIAHIFGRARTKLRRFFEDAAADGRLAAGSDPEQLGDFCYTIMQGGLVVSRVEGDVTPYEHAVAQTMAHVRSLVRDRPT